MSDQITTAFVQQYTTNVALLLQQRGSKLRPYVMVDSYMGKAAKIVEQIGQVAAQQRVSRHADTPLVNTPHDARWEFPLDWEVADLIDDQDRLRMIINPDSAYAINQAMAIGRAWDDEIITRALGNAKTGENGTTTTAFDTSNQQIAASSAGLTVAKLREAKKILMGNEVDIDFDPLYCIVTAKQIDDLLNTTEVGSFDYNSVKSLVNGEINTFMGFRFIHCERLGVDGSSNRRVIAYAKSGLHLGIWKDVSSRMSERDDKSYATQVYTCSTFGATRTEEGKVVEILCSES
jgi:hypothetical protein